MFSTSEVISKKPHRGGGGMKHPPSASRVKGFSKLHFISFWPKIVFFWGGYINSNYLSSQNLTAQSN